MISSKNLKYAWIAYAVQEAWREMENSEARGKDAQEKEQWLRNLTFPCVKCRQSFDARSGLMDHYERTRHDKYSEW